MSRRSQEYETAEVAAAIARRIELWQRVLELGAAGVFCDALVRQQPVPPALRTLFEEAQAEGERWRSASG